MSRWLLRERTANSQKLATTLRRAGARVFYDHYEQAELWGKDLYQHLQTVYRDEAKYCVILVSGGEGIADQAPRGMR